MAAVARQGFVCLLIPLCTLTCDPPGGLHPSQVLLQPSELGNLTALLEKSGNLVPSRFSGQIRKVEARLGKLAKIRKFER